MEITKAKNFDTNGVAEFESVDEETHEVTPDMKYIKWPSKKKVFSELVSAGVNPSSRYLDIMSYRCRMYSDAPSLTSV